MNISNAEKVKANKKVENKNLKNKNKKNKNARGEADVRKAAKKESILINKRRQIKITKVSFEGKDIFKSMSNPFKIKRSLTSNETHITAFIIIHVRYYFSEESTIDFFDKFSNYYDLFYKNRKTIDYHLWSGTSKDTFHNYKISKLRKFIHTNMCEYADQFPLLTTCIGDLTKSSNELYDSALRFLFRHISTSLKVNVNIIIHHPALKLLINDVFNPMLNNIPLIIEDPNTYTDGELLRDSTSLNSISTEAEADNNPICDTPIIKTKLPDFPKINGVFYNNSNGYKTLDEIRNEKHNLEWKPYTGKPIKWANSTRTDSFLGMNPRFLKFHLVKDSLSNFKQILSDGKRNIQHVADFPKELYKHAKEDFTENKSDYVKWYEEFKDNLLKILCLHNVRDSLSYIDYICSSIYYVYQAIRFRNRVELTATLIMLLRNSFPNCSKIINNYIIQYVETFTKSINNKVKAESFPDIDETFSPKKIFEMIISSQVVRSTRTFIINMVGLKFFSADMSERFLIAIGDSTIKEKKVSMLDFTSNMIEVVESFTRFGFKFYQTGSVVAALLNKDILSQFIDDTTDISLAFKTVYIGDDMNFRDTIAQDRMSAKDFLESINIFITKGNKYLDSMKTNPLFKTRLNELKMMKRSIMVEIASKRRMAPMGIILHGDPGIGKSSIQTNIYKSFCFSTDRKYSSDLVFHRAPKAKYWTGYDPVIHPIIHIPELGSISANLALQGDESINEMLCVCDNAPYCPDQAAIEDKGAKYAIPELVCIDTNNPEMNLKILMAAPAAIRRRFIYIEATVKPEYAIHCGVGIDPKKVLDAKDKMNIWDFRIYRQVPQAGDANMLSTKVPFTHDGEGDKSIFDMYGLCQFLHEAHKEHVANQKMCYDANDIDISKYMKPTDCSVDDLLKMEFKDIQMHTTPVTAEAETIQIGSQIHPNIVKRKLHAEKFAASVNRSKILEKNKLKLSNKEVNISSIYFHSLSTKIKTFICILYSIVCLYIGSYSLSIFILMCFIQLCFLTIFYQYLQWVTLNEDYVLTRRQLSLLTDSIILYRNITCSNFITSTCNIFTNVSLLSYLYVKTFFFKDERYNAVKWKVLSSKITSSVPPLLLIVIISAASAKMMLLSYKVAKSVLSESISQSGNYNAENIYRTVCDNEKQSCCIFPLPSKKRATDMDYDKVENITPFIVGNERNHNKIEELYATIESNVRYAKIRFTNDSSTTTKVLGVCNDYALVNIHCIKSEIYSVHLSTSRDSASGIVKANLKQQDFKKVGEDIFLVRIIGTFFKDITFAIADIPDTFVGLNGMFMNNKIPVRQVREEIVPINAENMVVLYPYKYIFPEHAAGDCGSPLLVTYGYKTFLVGVHCAGTNEYGYACKINKRQFDAALKDYQSTNILIDITSEGSFRLKDEGTITSVSPRSPLVYEDIPSLLVYGNISNCSPVSPKSTLTKSILFNHVEELINVSPSVDGHPKYLAPKMRSFRRDGVFYSPENNFVKKVGVITSALDNSIMENVIISTTCNLLYKLKKEGVTSLNPVPLDIAQNGFPENFYYRSMKNSTSGGFMFTGKKSKYIDFTPKDFKKDAVTPKPEVLIQVQEIIDSYLQDKTSHSIVGAQLKDEPRSWDKVIKGNTRMFAMSSYDMTLVNRMYLLPFYSMMCEHRDVFSTKIGINMHSDEVDKMYNTLKSFSSNIMEGDYGGYDTSMPIGIGFMSNSIVYTVLKKLGYNTHALQIVKGILTENLFPTVVLNGTVFTPPGFQPSGKYATAEDNSLRGVILLRYAFTVMCTPLGYNNALNLTTKFNVRDFDDLLLPITYGDDMLCGVKDELAPYFNNITYEKFVREVYYMTFTTSDKKEQTEKFVNIEDISFLKRTFRYHSLMKRIVAPLDKDSIMKSLCYYLPSKEITPEEQIIQTSISALTELFFHCEDQVTYDTYRRKIIDKLVDLTRFSVSDLEPLFKTWDSLLDKYSL